MSADIAALTGGFDDAVTRAQEVFRAVMEALARPGTLQKLDAQELTAQDMQPPAPLTPELAAIALTLADHETPLWLDAKLAGSETVEQWLRFHTGARIVADPMQAAFALIADPLAMPPLSDFAAGEEDYPDRSTTLLLAVEQLTVADAANAQALHLQGPGIRGQASLAIAPLPAAFPGWLAENRLLFPRGWDCVFAGHGHIAAIPRSTMLAGRG